MIKQLSKYCSITSTSIAMTMLFICTACYKLPPPIQNAPNKPKTPPKTVQALQHWQITGRAGAHTKDDSFSASLYWEQRTRNHYLLRLVGTFGAKQLTIRGQPGKATITDGEKSSSAPDANSLIYKETKWAIPVDQLYYWIRGMSVPNQSAKKTYDNLGRVKTLTQGAWFIQYKGYKRFQNLYLPIKIFIKHKDLKVRVSITNWII